MNTSNTKQPETSSDLFKDLKYLCQMSNLVRESLGNGCDIAHLPNGDIIVTEVKILNTHYTWSPDKQKMIKTSQY
jgi:hypothetical protein